MCNLLWTPSLSHVSHSRSVHDMAQSILLTTLMTQFFKSYVFTTSQDIYFKSQQQFVDNECSCLQVVWHSMQDEFLKQYKHYETLISRCYPDSGISLEFTITDLLGFFSDIAQSH